MKPDYSQTPAIVEVFHTASQKICKYVSRATEMRWIGRDKIGPRPHCWSDGRDTSVWIQPPFKQKWQCEINELDETKDLNTVFPPQPASTRGLSAWESDWRPRWILSCCLYILGSASEPVSVITIYQDLRVKEPVKTTAPTQPRSLKSYT